MNRLPVIVPGSLSNTQSRDGLSIVRASLGELCLNSGRQPICDPDRLRERMAAQKIDLLLASSRRNVAYLTDHQTAEWTWEHAILHMMEKEYDGWDYLLFAG